MTLPAIRLDLSDIRGYLPEDNDRGQPPESILGNVRRVGLGSGTDALKLSQSVRLVRRRPVVCRPTPLGGAGNRAGRSPGAGVLAECVSVDRPWIGRPNDHIACGRPPASSAFFHGVRTCLG